MEYTSADGVTLRIDPNVIGGVLVAAVLVVAILLLFCLAWKVNFTSPD